MRGYGRNKPLRPKEPPRGEGLRCLSLWQPYASLIVGGHIHVVTRDWYTSHRGQLMIHAAHRTASGPPALLEHAAQCLGETWLRSVTRSALVGTVQVMDCRRAVEWEPVAACETQPAWLVGELERGGYAWLFGQPVAFVKSVPFHGHRRMYVVPDHVVSEGELQLGLV